MTTASNFLSSLLGPSEDGGMSIYRPGQKLRESVAGKNRRGKFELGDLLELGLDPFMVAGVLGGGAAALNRLGGPLVNKWLGRGMGVGKLIAREEAEKGLGKLFGTEAMGAGQLASGAGDMAVPGMIKPAYRQTEFGPAIQLTSRAPQGPTLGGMVDYTANPSDLQRKAAGIASGAGMIDVRPEAIARGGYSETRHTGGVPQYLTDVKPEELLDLTSDDAQIKFAEIRKEAQGRFEKWLGNPSELDAGPRQRVADLGADPGNVNLGEKDIHQFARMPIDARIGASSTKEPDLGALMNPYGDQQVSHALSPGTPASVAQTARSGLGNTNKAVEHYAKMLDALQTKSPEDLKAFLMDAVSKDAALESSGKKASMGLTTLLQLAEDAGINVKDWYPSTKVPMSGIAEGIQKATESPFTNVPGQNLEKKVAELKAAELVAGRTEGRGGMATTIDSPNRVRDAERIAKEHPLLTEQGRGDVDIYSKNGTKIASGYRRVVYGDHGPYIEMDRSQVALSNFPDVKEKGPMAWYDEMRTADGDVMLYDQKRSVKTLKNPPAGKYSVRNNRKGGYADYVPGKIYVDPDSVVVRESQSAPTSVAAPVAGAESIAKALEKRDKLTTTVAKEQAGRERMNALRDKLIANKEFVRAERLQLHGATPPDQTLKDSLVSGRADMRASDWRHLNSQEREAYLKESLKRTKGGAIRRSLEGVEPGKAKQIESVLRDELKPEPNINESELGYDISGAEGQKFKSVGMRAYAEEEILAEKMARTDKRKRSLGIIESAKYRSGKTRPSKPVEFPPLEVLDRTAPVDARIGFAQLRKTAKERGISFQDAAIEAAMKGENTPEVTAAIDHIIKSIKESRPRRMRKDKYGRKANATKDMKESWLETGEASDGYIDRKFGFVASLSPGEQQEVLGMIRKKSRRTAAQIQERLSTARNLKDAPHGQTNPRIELADAFRGAKGASLIAEKEFKNLNKDQLVQLIVERRKDLADVLETSVFGRNPKGHGSIIDRDEVLKARNSAQMAKLLGEVISERGYKGIKKGDLITLLSSGSLRHPNVGMREKATNAQMVAALMPGISVAGRSRRREKSKR